MAVWPSLAAPSGLAAAGTAAGLAVAGVGKGEFDAGGGVVVAGEGGGDAADLFVAGHREESRGAAVGLHPDEVDAGFGVGEFAGAVRHDRAAGVHVGVDLAGEPDRRLLRR